MHPDTNRLRVGLMMPIGEGDDGVASWEELRAMAQLADEGGLDTLWSADHLIIRFDDEPTRGIHEAWTMLTAMAAVTRRIEIGPLVLALPYRNPALTAKMAAALEEVSAGRLVLGVGCGWHEPEFTAFDYPFDHRVGRFEEALGILLGMLRDGRADLDGRWHRARDAELRPQGPRAGGPPILIAGKQPRMLRLVARHADAWNAAWYGRWEDANELRQRLDRLDAALEVEGRDPSTLRRTVGLTVAFPHLVPHQAPQERVLAGTAEEVAHGFRAYAEAGFTEVIASLTTATPQTVGELLRAAELARAPVRAASGPR